MEPIVSGLAKINGGVLQAARLIVILSMAAIALIIPYEVLGRYVLGNMPAWSGEVATYALVWLTMMGAAAGWRQGYQISLTFLQDRLPPPWKGLLASGVLLFLLFFFSLLVRFGLQQTLVNIPQSSPALGFSMAFPYAALPLGFGMLTLLVLEDLLRLWQGRGS